MNPKKVIGFAIVCSFAPLWHAVTLAADRAAPAVANGVPTFAIRGTVVDKQGTAVAHATVATAAGRDPDVDLATVTDAAGSFTLDVPTWQAQVNLWARDEAGSRIGSLHDVSHKVHQPVRIVLRAARSIPVTVVDGKGKPVAGAKVGAFFRDSNRDHSDARTLQKLLEERTDAKGQAMLHRPPEIRLESVWAVKAGAGFDYVLYRRPIDERAPANQPRPDPAMRAPEDSRPIPFVFAGVQQVRVHVMNERRRPLPGVRICMRYLERPHRGDGVTVSEIDEFVATADSTGTAEFTAVPSEALAETAFQTRTVGYWQMDYAALKSSALPTDVTVIARPIPVLRVQVTYPDGRPALGARVHYAARHYIRRPARLTATMGERLYHASGETVVSVLYSDAYCVVSATIEGLTSQMEARVARMGEPMRPVHLVLRPATRVHGTLTVGKDRRPAANAAVTLIARDRDNYARLPEDERLPRTLPLSAREHVAMDLPLHTTTDELGRYQFDVAAGSYILGAGGVDLNEVVNSKDVKEVFPEGAREFEIKDQKELVIDLHSGAPASASNRPPRTRRPAPAKGGS